MREYCGEQRSHVRHHAVNQVIAFDTHHRHDTRRCRQARPTGAIVPHEQIAASPYTANKVYVMAEEAVLVALDCKTGTEVWTTPIADNESGYYSTLNLSDRRRKGHGGMLGRRIRDQGFVAAFDAETGKEIWRTFTVPRAANPAAETWPAGDDQWKTGGAPVAGTSGNYDPKLTGVLRHRQRRLPSATTVPVTISSPPRPPSLSTSPPARSRLSPIPSERFVGLRRNFAAYPGRLPAQRPDHPGLIDVARDGYLWFLERAGPIKFVEEDMPTSSTM